MAEMSPEKLIEVKALTVQYVEQRQWKLGKTLGSGGSAAVFVIERAEGKLALKTYDPSFFDEKNGPSEKRRIVLQEQLIGHSCESLVQIEEVEFANGTCYMLMEYVPGAELSKCLDKVPRAAIWPLMLQLVSAIKFLELSGLVHRDIKPHNIMVLPTLDKLKLIDLGVIRDLSTDEDRLDGTDHGKRRPFVATAQYSSPEYLFRLEAPSPELWLGLSIYQVGAVLHDLIMRKPLFAEEVATENRYAVAMAVLKKIPSLEGAEPVAVDLRTLAAHCLTKDLRRRLSLVCWDDFRPRGTDAVKELARRFEQLSNARPGQVTAEQERQRRELSRQESLQRTITELGIQVKDLFPGMQLEPILQKDHPGAYVLRFHLPDVDLALDMSIEACWLEDTVPDEAALTITGILNSASTSPSFVKGTTEVGALVSDGTNLVISVESLKSTFIKLATRALDEVAVAENPGAANGIVLSIE
jgi:serine/threonine protein kinase